MFITHFTSADDSSAQCKLKQPLWSDVTRNIDWNKKKSLFFLICTNTDMYERASTTIFSRQCPNINTGHFQRWSWLVDLDILRLLMNINARVVEVEAVPANCVGLVEPSIFAHPLFCSSSRRESSTRTCFPLFWSVRASCCGNAGDLRNCRQTLWTMIALPLNNFVGKLIFDFEATFSLHLIWLFFRVVSGGDFFSLWDSVRWLVEIAA